MYAEATKAICKYYVTVRPLFIKSNPPKILKLVDKEIIGVLQQKLVKILIIDLQTSFKEGVKKSDYLIKLIRNLLKCSPEEATIQLSEEVQLPLINQMMCMQPIDDSILTLLIKGRLNFLKLLIERRVFEAFKGNPYSGGTSNDNR